MSDLEEKIAAWRARMAAGGINSPAVLDELPCGPYIAVAAVIWIFGGKYFVEVMFGK